MVKRFPHDDFTDNAQCENGDHGSSMSPSLIILATISILLNIYFIFYFLMKRRERSKHRIANHSENPLKPDTTNPEFNVESPPDENLKSTNGQERANYS